MFIHQHKEWPKFSWDKERTLSLLTEIRYLQGKLLGRMQSLGFDLQDQAVLETITLDVVKTSEIEGEIMNTDEVRSSVARKLGIKLESEIHVGRYTDGVVEMMLDASQNYSMDLTDERMFAWHAALFPTGHSGMYKITVGNWRLGEEPMQVVSGPMGREKIHFEAPNSKVLDEEMGCFVQWANTGHKLDDTIKAAIAHLWFVTIHPFDDGNGRITRAITDMFLSRSDRSKQRFYSMSAVILKNKNNYYDILETTQKGNLDITEWIMWFLNCLKDAISSSEDKLSDILYKATFWNTFSEIKLNDRQKIMINKLLDGFDGKLRTGKWAKITKCTEKTALRDIEDLMRKQILKKGLARGRSTSYELIPLNEG
jgi:Fic family protein